MKPLSRRVYALTAITLAAVLFVAVNIVSDTWLRTARLDLTESGLYTLSNGTRATLGKIPEPITLRFFYSRDVAAGYAQVRAYAARVRDLLQEYAALAPDKLRLVEIDPEPYTPAEDDAVAAGLTAIPTQEGDTVYFGLAGANSIGGQQTIPFFDQAREQYLEYDLTSLIDKLSTPTKAKLGIITSLPLDTGAGGMLAAMQGNARPYMVYQQLHDSFDLQMLDQNVDRIPSGISTLLIVHPKALSDSTLYAIDQFVMRGGHAIVFVDPLSEIANAGANMGPGTQSNATSDLEPLLKDWGVAYDPSKVVADGARAQRVQMARGAPESVADYIIWLRLAADNPDGSDFNPTDPVTANLKLLNIASAGALRPIAGATTHFSPLVRSSAESQLLDTTVVRVTTQPDDLLRGFAPGGEKFTIAARLSGPVKSAFPKGAPNVPLPPGTAPPAPLPTYIGASKTINVIVMADSDIFDDRFWVQVQNVLGQTLAVPTADNGAFIVNAVENMMGSSDLISLRTRARSDRPFTVVQELQRRAQGRFLAEAQDLQQKVGEAEAHLRALEGEGGGESAGPKAGKHGAAKGEMLSPAQQAEIEKFRRQLVQSRAALRQVQANLRADVETLGARLAFINIALVPILVAAFAFGLAWLRRRRRARSRGLQ